jgi:phospholipase/carboxylesterase
MKSSSPHLDQPVRFAGAALQQAKAAVILIHGRGASAADILGLAGEMYDPEIAYLAPEAAGHTWYPYSFLAPLDQNEPWLSSALEKIGATIQLATSVGVPLNKTVLCGFSQGACLSTEFVARNPKRYGGLIAFTGGLIGPPGISLEHPGELFGTPAFLGSGDPDPHVPWSRVEESAQILTKMGGTVTLRRYPNRPHTVSEDEIENAVRIIRGAAAES